MKQFAVVFTENNARTIKGDIDSIDPSHVVILNPDLSKVRRIPPHFWMLENGEIVPMNPVQKKERMAHIEKHGAFNNVGYKKQIKIETTETDQDIQLQKMNKRIDRILLLSLAGYIPMLIFLVAKLFLLNSCSAIR